MGDQPGTCAAAAHAAGFPEPDLPKAADLLQRDDRDSRAVGRGGGSPARLMPPDRLPSRLPSIVRRFSHAYDAAFWLLRSCAAPYYEREPQKVRECQARFTGGSSSVMVLICAFPKQASKASWCKSSCSQGFARERNRKLEEENG